ncbi:MAG: ABC transporter ATP-binding protein [Candidatus Auribacter fodinae]|uniref:ABC transporter ATP-binding protein n=1 Tax=Candidatus Auribacter fodinae TaxID=2093366 RepID=A0A3A4QUT3_9BACT|nr:MAG: ABC transporter ATP-binding protein [Candidatus Auribacter fodinae]
MTEKIKKQIIIQATGIGREYRIGKQVVSVLKNIDLTIYKHDFMTISGASGVGKSTLLHILGLLDEPSEGKIAFQGIEIQSLSNARKAEIRNKSIGFIFQFFHLLPEFSAMENVLLPALMRRNTTPVKELKERSKALLDKVGLSHRMKHKPSELSGGEQQRVAIARAIMNKPDVIFADEPTGNLDSKASLEIQNLLYELNDQTNQTIVIVTHNTELAAIGRRKMHMSDGSIHELE